MASNIRSFPLFPPAAEWAPPKGPPRLDGQKILGVDTETRDPLLTELGPGFIRGDAQIAGASIATSDQAWYFPFNHPEDNCEWDVKSWLRDELSQDRKYVFCNCHYDVESLWSAAMMPGGSWTDIQIMQALLNEEFIPGYSLDAISNYWVGAGKDRTILDAALASYGFFDGTGIGYLPARYVGQYAETDALRTIQTYLLQLPEIESENLDGVLELEENLLQLTWQMRLNGVRLDRDRAFTLKDRFTSESARLILGLATEHGTRVDPRSSKMLARYCDNNNIEYPLTDKGNPSFTGAFLENHKSPVLSTVARVRKLDKMVNDFIEPWITHSNTTGRVHPQWKLTMTEDGGTRSGRLSSKDPNLQQVPIRDPEFGPLMRSLFLPEEGKRWGKLDVNSQEIRIAIHYAIAAGCQGVEAIKASYIANPRLDFHRMVADMAGVEREPAKTISLGTLYGMSERKMSAQMGFSTRQAEIVYARYFEVAPYFKELAELATERAEKRGYVETILGRRRRFASQQNLHKALNSIVQGSAADMIKLAMWNIWTNHEEVPMLTVHDELDYSVGEDCSHLTREIEEAIKFEIPMIVEPIIGENWNVGK